MTNCGRTKTAVVTTGKARSLLRQNRGDPKESLGRFHGEPGRAQGMRMSLNLSSPAVWRWMMVGKPERKSGTGSRFA